MTEAGGEEAARTVRDTGLAVVALHGSDATAYLEAQSMTALADLDAGRVRLCAFSDPRGRVLITAYAWRDSEGWRLAVPRSEAKWVAGHLLRFRFRARVEIAVAEVAVAGLLGTSAPAALHAWPAAGDVVTDSGFDIVALGENRRLIAASRATLDRTLEAMGDELPEADPEAWKLARLRAHEPEIRASTRAAFLPQTLGLESLGAIGLHKGCYPGQEIIARTQNLGRAKRRIALLRTDSGAEPGTPLDLFGVRVIVLDCAADFDGTFLLQAVAPTPLPPELASHRTDVPPPDPASASA